MANSNNELAEIAQALTAKGAKVGGKELEKLNTALIEAAKRGDTAEVRRLLDAGADVNAKGLPRGMRPESAGTALMWAASSPYAVPNAREDMTRLLIERGADVNSKDGYGYQVLDRAMEQRCPNRLVRDLINNGANVNGFIDRYGESHELIVTAASYCDGDIVRLMIKKGANPNTSNSNGETAWFAALGHRNESSIRALLEGGASVNAKAAGGSYKGWTARDLAEYYGASSIAQLLASKGGKSTGAAQAKRKRDEAERKNYKAEGSGRGRQSWLHITAVTDSYQFKAEMTITPPNGVSVYSFTGQGDNIVTTQGAKPGEYVYNVIFKDSGRIVGSCSGAFYLDGDDVSKDLHVDIHFTSSRIRSEGGCGYTPIYKN